MKILFDQGTPVPLRLYLLPNLVRTAAQQGWASLRNGDLLNAAEAAGFDLLLTTDRNLSYQQNLDRHLAHRKIAIIALDLQQWPRLRPHAEEIAEAVNAATPGSFIELNLRRHSS